MNKKYKVMLEAIIDITNTDQIINWVDQDWFTIGNDDCHSMCVTARKAIEIETDRIELYVKGVNELGGCIRVAWYEEIK